MQDGKLLIGMHLTYNNNQMQFQTPNTSPKPNPNSNSHTQKRQAFRQQIRLRQIDQLKKQIRQKYYQYKDPSDYQLLRNINLTKLIAEIKRNGLFGNGDGIGGKEGKRRENVHALFLYATSMSSDHLFQLVDQGLLRCLVDGLMGVGEGVTWDREILWILTNYTSYSEIICDTHLSNLLTIAKHTFSNPYHPTHEQTHQNLTLTLSNLLTPSKNTRHILTNHPQLLQSLLQNFLQKPAFSQKISKQGHPPRILEYYGEFLHNFYGNVDYYEIGEDGELQRRVVREIVAVVVGVGDLGVVGEEWKKLGVRLLNSVTKLFQNSFDKYPQLILLHKKEIKKLAAWFQKFVRTQKETPASNEIIVSYLIFLQTVYGPNIPEDIQEKVQKFYVKHFEQHVGKVCESVFLSKNPLFHNYALKLLQPILLQSSLSTLISTQYLPILSHIFHNIFHSSYPLKKQSLLCLTNLLKSTLYQQSQCFQEVLELLLANRVADILAVNLWAFVDGDLNWELLEAVEVLLGLEGNLYGARLRFWEMFVEAGGVLKMEAILQQSQNNVLKGEVIRILDIAKQTKQAEQNNN